MRFIVPIILVPVLSLALVGASAVQDGSGDYPEDERLRIPFRNDPTTTITCPYTFNTEGRRTE